MHGIISRFLGAFACIFEEWKELILMGMFGIISFMTLYRSYIGVLFIIPCYFSIKKYKWKGIILSCVLIGITASLYALITKYCCSPYIVNNINTEWVGIFATDIWEGIKYVFQVIIEKSLYLYREFIKKALEWGLFSGSLYVTTGLLTILLSIRVFLSKKDAEDRDSILLSIFYIIGVVGVILAIFLFYQVAEGARHLMGLIVVGGMLLALIKKKTLIMKLIVVAMCSYFFIIRIYAPYDWQVPFDDGKLKDEVTLLEEQQDEEMVLSESGVPWDNTVIWLSHDMSGEEVVNPTWGLLYAIPEGFALNFCSQSYVEENLDSLKSRYIVTWPGGDIETRLIDKGLKIKTES